MTSRKRIAEIDAYEELVFRNADRFTATLFAPRGATRRQDFTDFPSAIKAATALIDEYGRTGLLYACTPAGRSICIARKDWDRYLTIWKETHS